MWGDAFLRQARSDWCVYKEIQNLQVDDCHKLYYLRITTEKLGKAALLKSGSYSITNIRKHRVFVKYLQLSTRNPKLCKVLGIKSTQLKPYINSVLSLANSIEILAPGEGNNGANAEYPWEQTNIICIPAEHKFPETRQLRTSHGRKLIGLVQSILDNFEEVY